MVGDRERGATSMSIIIIIIVFFPHVGRERDVRFRRSAVDLKGFHPFFGW